MMGDMKHQRSTERGTTCPECGSAVRRIVFGMPTSAMAAAADRGEIFLGGCCLPPIGDATERCACGAMSFDSTGNRVPVPLHAVDWDDE